MTSRGRSFTQPSEWDSHDDFNESLYDPQYPDENASGGVNLDHCRLYITNIPRGLNDEGLRTAFSKFGALVEVYLSKDPLKKYGLIKYETPGEAKLAMMKMNKTEPLKLNISIAHKASKKGDDRTRRDWQDRPSNNGGRDRSSNKDESASIGSTSSEKCRERGVDRAGHDLTGTSGSLERRAERAQKTNLTDTMINGDNNMDDLIEDDYGFSDILDPNLTLELENLKMEQLKVKEEQLQCKHRMIMLKQQERRPLHHSTMSNRCILPDGKIVVRNVGDRSADLDHSAGAGDSRVPGLQRERSRECVSCGLPADAFCARCGVTPYCSPRCQAKDWNERHRAVCHNLARLAGDAEVRAVAADPYQHKIQNPAPLRRPHVLADDKRERQQRRDDDTATKVSDKSNKSFTRLQERANRSKRDSNSAKESSGFQKSPKHQNKNQTPNKNFQQRNKAEAPAPEPEPKCEPEIKAVVKPEPQVEKKPAPVPTKVPPPVQVPTPAPVPKAPQVNGGQPSKPASLGDVTPARKVVPKYYLIEQLSIGDTLLLSADAKATDCKSSRGDYVCLSMHEKFERDYQSLCEDYVVECDADQQDYKLTPGESCSYFNVEDGGWYRARCLNPTTLALIDSSKIVAVTSADKIRKLPSKYESIPEFCCLLDNKNIEVGANLKCTLLSKTGDSYKVSLENVDTGSSAGEGVLSRWIPTVEYPAVKPVIPEVPRPPLTNNSHILVVDATALDRVFVRPADTEQQREFDDVVQNSLLAGRKASPLTEPPQRGQTVIAKFEDGLHYRALCKRTSVAQNKYLLEYIEFGNMEVCRNLADIYPCPPNLELTARPTQVSMIKLSSDNTALTPPALEYMDKIKNFNEELVLTLPNGESSAPSGSEATLKLVKNNELVNKKVIEMCTPDWKKFEERGGDVVEIAPLMYGDLEYQELPSGPVVLDILDVSVLEGGMISGCLRGDPHADYVFKDITKRMADYCNSELGKEPYLPMIEELCIAQFPPYPQWFRAVLLEQEAGAGGDSARVCYVDYGNVERVPVELLRKMLPDFIRGVPVVVSHLEIKDFPKDATQEMIVRAAQHMKLDEDGRGVLSVRRCEKQEDGLYVIDAPDLLKAMRG